MTENTIKRNNFNETALEIVFIEIFIQRFQTIISITVSNEPNRE